MTSAPKMKRVTISSATELSKWLARSDGRAGPVMLVTHTDRASPKHVSRTELQSALQAQGWVSGPRYTLSKALLGNIVHR